MHVASIEGHSKIVERLVGCGADLNCVDVDGNTALNIILIKKDARPLTDKTPQLVKV